MNSVDNFKSGYIAIVGRPNVGKSTLMNCLLDFKLSIISPRPQTTRKRIMGIMNKPGIQIIFLDTPGLIVPEYRLQHSFGRFIESSIYDADLILHIVACVEKKSDLQFKVNEDIDDIKRINPQKKPVFLVINKVDLYPKDILLPLLENYAGEYDYNNLIPVSALKNDGLSELVDQLIKGIPFHPPFYDPEILTEQPERFFVSEFIREQLFLHFREEIPYSTEVQIEDFIEHQKRKDLIRAIIYVERDSQKGIIIGNKGTTLKNIGIHARREIETFLGREIFLELRVKVSKDWRKKEEQLKKFGYSK